MAVNTVQAELAELAATYADAKRTLNACRDRLQHKVVDAIDDHGLTIPQIARTLGVTKPRIYAIIEHVCRQP